MPQSLALGADLVIHSATRCLDGWAKNGLLAAFDTILSEVCAALQQFQSELQGIGMLTVVRDLWGRVRLVAPTRPDPGAPLAQTLEGLARNLQDRLGRHAYPPEQTFLYADELAEFTDLEAERGVDLEVVGLEARLIDRQLTGTSWAEVPAGLPQHPARLTFYSIKGGVGRSTAVAVAAWRLAQEGRNVLVLDLDLEAPGLSSALLPQGILPRFGIVDWFVEDLVGQADEILDDMAVLSPVATDLPGEVWMVPSYGAAEGEYIAKLGRCYLDLPPSIGRGGEEVRRIWPQRLLRLLEALEARYRPDVVLLDSRSGLHDVASAVVTDVEAQVLLFAVGSDQTWRGYRLLFEHWQRHDAASAIRERLRVVASLVPETGRAEYLSAFREASWDLFREHLYDEVVEGALDGFSYDLMDDAGPHAPLLTYWSRGFASLSNLVSLDPQLVETAYGPFLDGLQELLLPPLEGA